jgi:transcriptional regulator with XRE-family HTH domain
MKDLEDRWAEVGAFIRDQRQVGRISLRKLSEMAGISNPYLSQIERGLRKPSADILQQIAKALRISAETLICTKALAVVIMISDVRPQSGSITANVRYEGINPDSSSTAPKAIDAPMMIAWRGRRRRAASSDPASDPTARIEPSKPYSPAPLPNTSVAIRAVVIWKLSPNVPAQNTMARIIKMSGRERTYRTPSRNAPFVRTSVFVGHSSLSRIIISEITMAP